MLNIIFAGTPHFAAEHLSSLLDMKQCNVVAVITQPDKKKGRGKKVLFSPVKTVALEHQLTVLQPTTLNDSHIQDTLASFHADLFIVVAYGQILPKAVLTIPRLGCFNVHASLLPRWRGAAPIERAIEHRDAHTGICIMKMDEGLDNGPVLLSETVQISYNETGDSLREKLIPVGYTLLNTALVHLESYSQVKLTEQNHDLATYASKLTKHEAKIEWNLCADELAAKIHAFVSENVCYTELNINNQPSPIRIKIWDCQRTTHHQNDQQKPGTIVSVSPQGIYICCKDSVLQLTKIQLPGGKPLDVKDVLNSRAHWFSVGSTLT
jgi:methionyl-tRNA formyltransferase